MSLIASFMALSASRVNVPENAYLVEVVEAPQATYIACSNDGRPGLFIAVAGVGDSPGVKLRNLELRHGTTGDLRTAEGETISGTYTLIECLSHDARLHQAFLELASEVLHRKTAWLDSLELERGFTSLVELFRGVSQPSTSSWLGTWGELFVMKVSPQPEELLACWHVDPQKLHDFSLGTKRLEVKTTTGQTRRHDFSLSQLDESDRQVYVASIVTHESAAGVTPFELFDEIRSRVGSLELRLHLDSVITKMHGVDFEAPGAPRYDLGEAQQSLRVYPASEIPAPTNPTLQLVDNVRFRSNLSNARQCARVGQLLELLPEGSLGGL